MKTGVAISDFLIGHPNTYGQDSPDNANANYWNWGIFAQDDWRFTPRLTLNLGLRYDIQTAPTDTQRRYSILSLGCSRPFRLRRSSVSCFPEIPAFQSVVWTLTTTTSRLASDSRWSLR